MKRAIGFIAATLLTTSIYSQDYSSNGSLSNPDSTPDYRSRQSEAGDPGSSESSLSSSAGYDKAPGLSGGNSSTGQSNGSNIGSASDQDQSLTTRDSDLSGSEYRGTLQSEANQSFNSELNSDRSSNSGSSSSSASGSSSSDLSSDELKGSGTADGAFHEPAAPVREGSQSEGWSASGTFSGAGPGAVSGSESSSGSSDSSSSSSYDRATSPTESSQSFSSDLTNNSALDSRDQSLINRGLEPDSDQLSRSELNGDLNNDTLIMEDWTIITPDSESNVGAPAESESGVGSSSDYSSRDDLGSSSSINFSSSMGSDSYSQDLYRRTQKDWSARTGTTDVPATTGLMDQSLDQLGHVRFYNDTTQSDVGAPGSSVSGSRSKADDDSECDHDKNVNKGSAPDYEHGDRSSSDEGSSKDHINREASGDRSSSDTTSAPADYGDRPDASNYDDGHLSGNNAIGSSSPSESSSSSSSNSSDQSQRSTDGSLYPPDL